MLFAGQTLAQRLFETPNSIQNINTERNISGGFASTVQLGIITDIEEQMPKLQIVT